MIRSEQERNKNERSWWCTLGSWHETIWLISVLKYLFSFSFNLTWAFLHKAKWGCDLTQHGSAYFKVEKVVSCVLWRPCVEEGEWGACRWVWLCAAPILASWSTGAAQWGLCGAAMALWGGWGWAGMQLKESICYKTCMKDKVLMAQAWRKSRCPNLLNRLAIAASCCVVEGIESKMLALLTHLGKPFSYFDFLAAVEHPVLKYHKVSWCRMQSVWGSQGGGEDAHLSGARGAQGEQSSILFWGWCPNAMNGSVLFWQSLSAHKRYEAFENVS